MYYNENIVYMFVSQHTDIFVDMLLCYFCLLSVVDYARV